MIDLVLFGLLGVAVFGTVFGGIGGSDTESETATDAPQDAPATVDIPMAPADPDLTEGPTPPVVPVLPETPEGPTAPVDVDPTRGTSLAFDGTDTLTGGEGNDTLAGGQNLDDAPFVVNLLGGADVATVDLPAGMAVFGGAGDDRLTSTAVGNSLFGGEGDDTLSGIDATNMYGGVGDDTLTINLDVELNDATAVLDGGAGDDSLTAHVRADNFFERGGALLTGGEGADSFSIVMDLTPVTPGLDGVETGTGGALNAAQIVDFDPAVDDLTIEIDAASQTEAFGLDRVEFEQTADGDGFLTQVQLYFANTAGAAAYQSTSVVTIRSAVPFTMADINFVNA